MAEAFKRLHAGIFKGGRVNILADMSPQAIVVVNMLLGVFAKVIFDGVVNVFKNTIGTPARVTKLEEDFKREFDALKEWKGAQEKSIKTNWEKFEGLDERVREIEIAK